MNKQVERMRPYFVFSSFFVDVIISTTIIFIKNLIKVSQKVICMLFGIKIKLWSNTLMFILK